jgi:hypothetical protein
MLAGRPHEAVGNDSPRWMIAAPRERGTEPGLQADSPPSYDPDLRRSITYEHRGTTGGTCAAMRKPYPAHRARSLASSGTRVPVEVDGGSDGPVAEPAGRLGDRDAFGVAGLGLAGAEGLVGAGVLADGAGVDRAEGGAVKVTKTAGWVATAGSTPRSRASVQPPPPCQNPPLRQRGAGRLPLLAAELSVGYSALRGRRLRDTAFSDRLRLSLGCLADSPA